MAPLLLPRLPGINHVTGHGVLFLVGHVLLLLRLVILLRLLVVILVLLTILWIAVKVQVVPTHHDDEPILGEAKVHRMKNHLPNLWPYPTIQWQRPPPCCPLRQEKLSVSPLGSLVSWCFNLGYPFSCPWHPMPIPCRLLVEVTTPTIATILKIRRILIGLAPEWLPGGGFSWWALRFWRDACYVSFLHKSYPISIQDLFIRRPGRSIIGC